MNRIGETQPSVLSGDFLLLEVNQCLVESVLEVAGDLLGFVFLGAEDGVTPKFLLHLPAFVPKIRICLDWFRTRQTGHGD